MSNEDRPEFRALGELERVLEHVQEELASFRRRAHKAELDRAEMGIDHDVVASREMTTSTKVVGWAWLVNMSTACWPG